MSQINVDIVAPFSGNDVSIVDSNNDSVAIVSPSNYLLAIGGDNGSSVNGTIKIGRSAGFSMTSNVNGGCIAIGQSALSNGSDAGNNLAIGDFALEAANGTTGVSNVAIGSSAGKSITSGSNNTILGNGAGFSVVPLTTGSNNTIIGYQAYPVGVNANNSVTLGNASIATLRCAVTSITSLSDARDKKDIAPIELGLEFVKELNPVKFVWDDRNEGGKHDIIDSGFIAQDLKALEDKYDASDVLKLVYDENPEKLEASYGRLIPVLVQAIKDLAAEVEALKNK